MSSALRSPEVQARYSWKRLQVSQKEENDNRHQLDHRTLLVDKLPQQLWVVQEGQHKQNNEEQDKKLVIEYGTLNQPRITRIRRVELPKTQPIGKANRPGRKSVGQSPKATNVSSASSLLPPNLIAEAIILQASEKGKFVPLCTNTNGLTTPSFSGTISACSPI